MINPYAEIWWRSYNSNNMFEGSSIRRLYLAHVYLSSLTGSHKDKLTLECLKERITMVA